MKLNTLVVKALVELQELDFDTIARMAHVSRADLLAWLYGGDDAAQERIAPARRVEILKLLGIDEDSPRADVVHHWKVREPFFGSTSTIYWAVTALTRAFGAGKVVYFSPENRPGLTFTHESRFGIQFDKFQVVLTVEGHAMRSSRFDPDRIEGLGWLPGSAGILLDQPEYEKLIPGELPVTEFSEHIEFAQDAVAWQQVSLKAREAGVRPTVLIDWVSQQGLLPPPPPRGGLDSIKVSSVQDRIRPVSEPPSETAATSMHAPLAEDSGIVRPTVNLYVAR